MTDDEPTPADQEAEREPTPATGGSETGDLLFDAVYGAAFGGAAIALFFLVVDSLAGRPLYTPSLMGTVLFTDTAPSAVTGARLDMVAYFTIVHFATFGVLGMVISRMCRRSGLIGSHPVVVAGVVFAILTVALLLGDLLFMPGIISEIGVGLVLAANAVTGVVMALFLKWAHRPA